MARIITLMWWQSARRELFHLSRAPPQSLRLRFHSPFDNDCVGDDIDDNDDDYASVEDTDCVGDVEVDVDDDGDVNVNNDNDVGDDDD